MCFQINILSHNCTNYAFSQLTQHPFLPSTHLWWHRERSKWRVQVEGQRLTAEAVRLHQLLWRHRLKLYEVIHWRVLKVRRLDTLRVEGPSVVWNVTEGEAPSRVVICALFNGSRLTFINLPHISEVGVQLCRRSIVLWFIWKDFLWCLWRGKNRFMSQRKSKFGSLHAEKKTVKYDY